MLGSAGSAGGDGCERVERGAKRVKQAGQPNKRGEETSRLIAASYFDLNIRGFTAFLRAVRLPAI
jgi:hypothetical protein